MRYLFKKVLRQLCTSGYLDKNFYFDDDLVDKFLEQFIFTSSEKDNVDVEKTNKHKIIRMVEILAIKTDDVYDTLKQCLHDDHQHVVDEMLKLEKDLDKECENCLESICRFLESNYKESKERKFSKAKLSDVQNTITNHVRASKRFRDTLTGVLDEDLMIQSLKKTFPSSDIETMTYKMPVSPKSKGGKMKSPRNRDATERFVTGIEPRSDSQRSRYDSSESSSSETDEGSVASEQQAIREQITRPPPQLMTNPHVNTLTSNKNFKTGENSYRNLDLNRYPPRESMAAPSQSQSKHGPLPYSQKNQIDSSLLFCPQWERYQPPHSNWK